MKFQSDPHRESYDDFPRSRVWNVIQQSTKRATSSVHISANIVQKALKFEPEVHYVFVSNGFFFTSEMSQKKSYSENATVTYLE